MTGLTPEIMKIVFDLDGTLCDPAEGITTSINHALKKLGKPGKSEISLLKYIGPPLADIFTDILGKKDPALISSAIASYRDRYYREGYRQSVIYPGITQMLSELYNAGHQLFIATAKKRDVAERIAEYFDITRYFKKILGCGLTKEKHELLFDIRNENDTQPLIMVGDRSFDMAAGRKTGSFCIGVLWGYGSREELYQSGADMLLKNPSDLIDIANDQITVKSRIRERRF